MDEFQKWKRSVLEKVDISKKGNLDERIEQLVKNINGSPYYYTTSSCSGRIIICSDMEIKVQGDEPLYSQKISSKKCGCNWYLSSHDCVQVKDASLSISTITESSKLKFEPFILHVQCYSFEAAHLILEAAISAGFRNSGISCRKNFKKITVAVRASASLEVPLTAIGGKKLVSEEYMCYVVELANRKLEDNFARIKSFEEKLSDALKKNS